MKDVDVKVGSMKAEVEEMTRDRRNNILLHGLPYQVQGQKEQHTPPRSTIPGTGTGGTTYSSSMVYHTRYRDRRNNILLHVLLDP